MHPVLVLSVERISLLLHPLLQVLLALSDLLLTFTVALLLLLLQVSHHLLLTMS